LGPGTEHSAAGEPADLILESSLGLIDLCCGQADHKQSVNVSVKQDADAAHARSVSLQSKKVAGGVC